MPHYYHKVLNWAGVGREGFWRLTDNPEQILYGLGSFKVFVQPTV